MESIGLPVQLRSAGHDLIWARQNVWPKKKGSFAICNNNNSSKNNNNCT